MKWITRFCVIACLVLLAGATASRADLKLELNDRGLRVEGADPGAEIALLSVWQEVEKDGPHSHQTVVEDEVTDDDGDGVVDFEVDREVPTASIWAVVDSKTGESAVIAPSGFSLRSIVPAKEIAFSKQLGRLIVMRTELEVLLVRPGVGRWRGHQRDGVHGDRDERTDSGLTLDLDALRPEKGDHGPKIAEGDTLIAIDPIRMEVLRLRVE